MNESAVQRCQKYSSLNTLVSELVAAWPQNERSIEQNYSDKTEADFSFLDEIAQYLLLVADGNLSSFVADYKTTCKMMMQCEKYYRRNKSYEMSEFREVESGIYQSETQMKAYMRGLLISQVLWQHHSGPLQVFKEKFLPACPSATRYVEVGPGHGLWMACAARGLYGSSLTGWDISQHSLDETNHCLTRIGIDARLNLEVRDICSPIADGAVFDVAVISQVLEIVQDPQLALDNIAACLKPGGRLFVNAPIRAVAPDHIRRWESGDDITKILEKAGFDLSGLWRFAVRGSEISDADGFSLVVIARLR